MKPTKLSFLSAILCFAAAAALVVSIFVPLWRIELDAPQYPEGLALQIHPNKLAGDVEIINGLNHYIGMRTLHAEDFIEFTVLPYIIGFFALLALVTAVLRKRKWLYTTFALFVAFGIIAMIDFWRWEYDYGHNLDENAAIKVPGMAYQPPLIGFKQLLNFGAYSIPDIGGWLFIAAGLLLLTAVVLEVRAARKVSLPGKGAAVVILALVLFSSCSQSGPEPIRLHKDQCAHCKMPISDARFGCELITDKGKVYKYDDIICLKDHMKAKAFQVKSLWIHDYANPGTFVDLQKAILVESETLRSPMGGNIAAFGTEDTARKFAAAQQAITQAWSNMLP